MEVDQTLVNAGIALFNLLIGWGLKVVWDALRDLQKADRDLTNKVNAIELLVAGKYVTRDEFAGISEKIFNKLDEISEKLSKKADK